MAINIGYLTANKTSAGDEVRFISILPNRGFMWNEAA